MAIIVLLVIIWMTYLVAKHLLAQPSLKPGPDDSPRTGATPPPRKVVTPTGGGQTDTGGRDGRAWSALDDHQLTRLLISSAPRTMTE